MGAHDATTIEAVAWFARQARMEQMITQLRAAQQSAEPAPLCTAQVSAPGRVGARPGARLPQRPIDRRLAASV